MIGVWVLLLACLILELIVHPVLYHSFGLAGSLLMLCYCLLGLAALTHTVVKTPREALRRSGMGLILVGLLVAVVPTLAALVSGFSLPGSGYYPFLFAAIPLTMALAVRKQARLGEVQVHQCSDTVGMRACHRRSAPPADKPPVAPTRTTDH